MSKTKGSDKDHAKDSSKTWMMNLTIENEQQAAYAYMPYIKGGAVFIETTQDYALGDAVFVLLTVANKGNKGGKYPINGKVVWVSSAGVRGERPQGIGVQFPKDDTGDKARQAMEAMMGTMSKDLKKTATL